MFPTETKVFSFASTRVNRTGEALESEDSVLIYQPPTCPSQSDSAPKYWHTGLEQFSPTVRHSQVFQPFSSR